MHLSVPKLARRMRRSGAGALAQLARLVELHTADGALAEEGEGHFVMKGGHGGWLRKRWGTCPKGDEPGRARPRPVEIA